MCLADTARAEHGHEHHHDHDHGPRVTRRSLLGAAAAGAMATVLAPAAPALAAVPRSRSVRDLTHTFRAGFPSYSMPPPVKRTAVTIERDGYYGQEWTFFEHSGTHVDVPGHFTPGGRLAPALRADELVVPVAVIDISARAARDADAAVTVDDLERYEHGNGRIPRGAGVFMYSGWESRVGDPDAYRNADAAGTYRFPGFGAAAVDWLLERRGITCIGVDTLSLDPGNSTTFPVHTRLLGADRYGIENLANLRTLPAHGATAIVGMVPWEEGSGGPARVLALTR